MAHLRLLWGHGFKSYTFQVILNPLKYIKAAKVYLNNCPGEVSAKNRIYFLRGFQSLCTVKKIMPRTGQTFWDRQLCFYVKKSFVSKKHGKVSFYIFHRRFMSSNFAAGALKLMRAGHNLWHKSPLKNDKVHFSVFFH